MSMKPPVITTVQVSEQTNNLMKTERDMQLTVRQLETRLAAIERSLAENETLRNVVRKQREDSFGQFQLEWRKRKDLFPDIRFAIITKTVELLTPPKKDKKEPPKPA
jgi:hypothetical protein